MGFFNVSRERSPSRTATTVDAVFLTAGLRGELAGDTCLRFPELEYMGLL
jgi:hypothetical protein